MRSSLRGPVDGWVFVSVLAWLMGAPGGAAAQPRDVRSVLAALPEDIQTAAAVDRAAYFAPGSEWVKGPLVLEGMAVAGLIATQRPQPIGPEADPMAIPSPEERNSAAIAARAKLNAFLERAHPQRFVLGASRLLGIKGGLGLGDADAVAILEFPQDVPVVPLLLEFGAAEGGVPACDGCTSLSVAHVDTWTMRTHTTAVMVLPDGTTIWGARAADVRDVALSLLSPLPDPERELERRWGPAAALLVPDAVIQIIREYELWNERVTPVLGPRHGQEEARNVFVFLATDAARPGGILRAFSPVRDQSLLSDLFTEGCEFQELEDGFRIKWTPPLDSSDVQGYVGLHPVSLFGARIAI